jgi:hypothetical protein
MDRQRVAHNHIYQAASVDDAVVFADDGCMACALIRHQVMLKPNFGILKSVDPGVPRRYFGEVPCPSS